MLAHCRGHLPLAARALRREDGRLRIALVQTTASLLSGDVVRVEVEVGPGAALELTTIGATVAYPAAAEATHSLECRVGANGRFAWLPQPLVAARACRLTGDLQLDLADGAAAVTRDIVVLGRHGEPPGRCDNAMRCDLAGMPLLRDRVAIEPDTAGSRLRLDGARAYGSLSLLGLRREGPPAAGELDLAGPGQVLRVLGRDAAVVAGSLAAVEPSYLERLWRAVTPDAGYAVGSLGPARVDVAS